MKQHKALELVSWIEEDSSCGGDAQVIETIRRQHALIVQMREALQKMVGVWEHGSVDVYPIGNARSSIAAATEYLGEQE